MNGTVLADPGPRAVSWPVEIPDLADMTTTDIASFLATVGSSAPARVPYLRADLPNGDQVWVFRDANGQFDPANPIYATYAPAVTVAEAPPGTAQICVDYIEAGADRHARVGRTLTAAGIEFTVEGGLYLVPTFSPFAMTDGEAVRWLRDHGVRGLHL